MKKKWQRGSEGGEGKIRRGGRTRPHSRGDASSDRTRHINLSIRVRFRRAEEREGHRSNFLILPDAGWNTGHEMQAAKIPPTRLSDTRIFKSDRRSLSRENGRPISFFPFSAEASKSYPPLPRVTNSFVNNRQRKRTKRALDNTL